MKFLSFMRLFVTQDVLSLFAEKKKFILFGHSFGGMVAIELAKVLEKNGLTGEVVCVDGSILLFKQFLKAKMPNIQPTNDNVQNFLLSQLAFEILPELQPDVIRNVIFEEKTYEDRIDKYISLMKKMKKREYSDGYLKNIGFGLANRIKMVLAEKEIYSGDKIKSNITLVRPSTNLVIDIDNDYQLKQYTSGQVEVKFIEGNHLTVLDNIGLYQIVDSISKEKTRN